METIHGKVRIHVDAPPVEVYALVADVTRTPEWSPEVVRCRWTGPARPAPGARFRGTSRSGLLRWTRTCEVQAAIPGVEFSFTTLRDAINRDSTTWRFTFEPSGQGTLLTESFEIHELPGLAVRVVSSLLAARPADMTLHVHRSLGRIKAIVERERAAI